MKFIRLNCICIIFFILPHCNAQNSFTPVTKKEVKNLVMRLADSLSHYYVSIEQGKVLNDSILKKFNRKEYHHIQNPDSLAKRITSDLRAVHGDLHLYVTHKKPNQLSLENDLIEENTVFNGLDEIKFYDKNIVYLKFKNFGNWSNASDARQAISNTVTILHKKKALIIDVRDNPGGVPFIVSHFLSYFFDKGSIKLANYYIRHLDYSYSIYTEPNIPGTTFPDIPIYVLVNKNSASAAEELAFWLKGQKRATIIGERTIGAGYGAREFQLNDRFFISISNEIETDPNTNKGFQITGVTPNILVSSEESLTTALKLAKDSIQKNNSSRTIKTLKNSISKISGVNMEEEIELLIREYHNEGILSSTSINELGYDFFDNPKKAKTILKMNTILHPFYPNSFDSYAEALVANKEYKKAQFNFEKAVTLATIKQNQNLENFKDNASSFLAKFANYKNEKVKIEKALQDYIEGSTNGKPILLQHAFHQDLNLYYVENNKMKIWTGQAYIKSTKNGVPTGEKGEILSIDFTNDAAIAKVKISSPDMQKPYIDYFMLLKLEEKWTIIHKMFTKQKTYF